MTETRTVGVSGGGGAAAAAQPSPAEQAAKAEAAVKKMALTPILNNAVKMVNRAAQENQEHLKGK
jgi:hypothetical protein